MHFLLTDREEIDLAAYRRVAWQGHAVALSATALERIAAARAGFLRLLQHPEVVIYGVTSGYGQRAHERLSPEERKRHAARPPLAPAVSFGAPLPERVARGIVLARLANLVGGHAAVSAELVQVVAAQLDGRPLPPVPADGNGMAGEITPLSHLFGPLLSGIETGEKECLALINGSPVAAALAAEATLLDEGRLQLAGEIFALSWEALAAPWEHLDPALADLWGDPDQGEAQRRLNALSAGGSPQRRPYQAPVSWRILPRVLGQGLRAQGQLAEVADSALSAVTDNPVYLAPDSENPDGRILSNGGYHEARVAPALDGLAATLADLALLADRQVSKLLDGRVSRLPHQLQAGDGYMGTLGFAAAGFAEQARSTAQSTLLPGSEGGGFGQNDVAVPVFHAWRRHGDVGRAFENALAVLAAVASQALYVTDRSAPPALTELLDTVRACVPPLTDQRALGPEVEALSVCLRERIEAGQS